MFTAYVISLKKVQKQEVDFLDALASLDLKLWVSQSVTFFNFSVNQANQANPAHQANQANQAN